jgi:hypothetical protein
VCSLDMETLRKIPFHLQPFAVVPNPAAPGANFEQAFEVMQAIHQLLGKAEHDGPNIYNYERLGGSIAPIPDMSSSSEQDLRQPFNFVNPGESNYQ